MLGNWLLLLLMLPGWFLPSGLSVPLCGCIWSLTETRSCCAPVEVVSCCPSPGDEARQEDARPEQPSDEDSAPIIASDDSCRCSVAVPAHEGGQAVSFVTQAEPGAPKSSAEAPRVARIATATVLRANPDRPRGPSPGGPNPLPLRL